MTPQDFCEWYGGVTNSGNFTTGSGRYTKRRTLPAFVREFERRDIGSAPRLAREFFENNPKVRKVLTFNF